MWSCGRSTDVPPWSICVVDVQGRWLAQWRSQFSRLGITHLRSTMVLHPDTEDEYGFHRWANTMGRLGETIDVRLPPGKYPEHDELLELLQIRNAEYFRRPSAALFDDFCDCVVGRLPPHTLLAGACEGVAFDQARGLFEAKVRDRAGSQTGGAVHKIAALAVCFCMGSSIPNVPEAFRSISSDRVKHTVEWSASDIGLASGPARNDGHVGHHGSCVVVVGGGLSSAQVALDYASRGDGTFHVYLLTRRKAWLVRDFDVPVHWVDRWTEEYTALRRDFAARPFAEKVTRIRSVREGGSIPPYYFELLLAEQAKGRLTLLTGAEVKQAEPSEEGVSLLVESGDGQLRIQALEVVLATGTQLAVDRVPCLEWLRQHQPIGEHGGAPAVQPDLRWAPGVDAFVLGAYGALQLGPDAVNLAGARRGSRAVARELWDARLRRCRAGSGGGRAPPLPGRFPQGLAREEGQAGEPMPRDGLQDEENDQTTSRPPAGLPRAHCEWGPPPPQKRGPPGTNAPSDGRSRGRAALAGALWPALPQSPLSPSSAPEDQTTELGCRSSLQDAKEEQASQQGFQGLPSEDYVFMLV